ncbi:hypothetical protein pah_c010o031 [Parachlamydia acanthamoebae str. Hall's coccus]|nr:hypothetical protein pah_c010o031 [Parachlamydia acanthamoebae str. Hall's coccus]
MKPVPQFFPKIYIPFTHIPIVKFAKFSFIMIIFYWIQ